MKILRAVIGIASILAFFIMFVISRGNDHSEADSIGVIVGAILFFAGVIGCTKRMSKVTGIIATALYVIAAVIGFANTGAHSYLMPWSIGAAVAAVIFIACIFLMKKEKNYGEMPKFK